MIGSIDTTTGRDKDIVARNPPISDPAVAPNGQRAEYVPIIFL